MKKAFKKIAGIILLMQIIPVFFIGLNLLEINYYEFTIFELYINGFYISLFILGFVFIFYTGFKLLTK